MCVEALKSAIDFASSVDIKAPGDLFTAKLEYAQYLTYLKGREEESLALMDELEKEPMMAQVKATNPLFLPSVRANAYFSIQDQKKYMEAYGEMISNPYYTAVVEPERQYLYDGYYMVCKGRYDEALALSDSIRNPVYACDIRQAAYEGKGDWKSACDVLKERIANQTEIFRAYQSEDVAVLDAELDNGALREAANATKIKLQQTTFTAVMIVMALLLAFLIVTITRSRKYIDKLKAADEAKSRFVKNMSHEVRTPLNAIIGFSQLLALPDGSLTDEEKDEYQEYIISNSEILTMLIDDILNAGEMESGNYTIATSEYRPEDVCAAAMKSIEYHLPGGVALNYESDVPEGFKSVSDSRRIQQILVNLLSNACKNTVEGSILLKVALSEDGSRIEYSVTDTGCGIPADKARKIFERFYKIDSFKQGAGLGLSISREIAKILGGDLYLDTSYTSGARFVLNIGK